MICFCAVLLGYAQDAVEPGTKSTVLVDYFTYPSNVTKEQVAVVRNNVLSNVIQSGRVIVIDVESDKVQEIEKLRRTQNDMSVDEDNNMERLSAIGVLGAEYVISGQITSLTTTRKESKDSEGKTKISYESKLMYSIKVIKVKDGTIVVTKSYTESATSDTESESVNSAFGKAGKVKKFIETQFKVEGTIIEVSKEEKGKAEEVYINIGSNNGIAKNARFKVFAVRQVAGRTVNKEIGEIAVEAVEGEDVSCCKVKKGGDLILKSMRDGETLVIKSHVRTTLLEKANSALESL
ncbi:MAG: penicillin-binding protein activator LpoB [Bacteroides sp.]|nr:penicillin-binding protein activator LpoB [Roseburia sp.]MCM1347096.1 penicillin-binding protein activator LpoB [Bacteroides sp.]MCM1421617.1 penicillin-binding protein activator LpoB [Bacteroides sp.]